jgi:xanthine dehydrogenase YagS FAD-binding subunit
MLPKISYRRPRSLEEALKDLALPVAHVHAGGTDLIGCLQDGILSGGTVVSLSQLSELKGISTSSEGGLRIGALTTLADVASHSAIQREYTALAQGAVSAASPQLRNQGTLGGNLCQRPRCWYFRGEFQCLRKGGEICYAVEGENENHALFGGAGCYYVHPSDTASPLLALGARIRIVGGKGERTIPLKTFFVSPQDDVSRETILGPGEIVAEILLPPPLPGLHSTYRKIRARGAWDFALAGIAVTLQISQKKITQARLVLSGVAPIPWALPEVELMLTGQSLNSELIKRAAATAVKNAQPLRHNGYKVELIKGVVEETLQSMVTTL